MNAKDLEITNFEQLNIIHQSLIDTLIASMGTNVLGEPCNTLKVFQPLHIRIFFVIYRYENWRLFCVFTCSSYHFKDIKFLYMTIWCAYICVTSRFLLMFNFLVRAAHHGFHPTGTALVSGTKADDYLFVR